MTTQIEYEILHTNEFQSNPSNHYHYRYQRKWNRIIVFLILFLLFVSSVLYPPLGLPHSVIPAIWVAVPIVMTVVVSIVGYFIKAICYTIEALVEWLKGY